MGSVDSCTEDIRLCGACCDVAGKAAGLGCSQGGFSASSLQDSERSTVAGHGAKVSVVWTEWAVGGRDPWGLESLRSCPVWQGGLREPGPASSAGPGQQWGWGGLCESSNKVLRAGRQGPAW